MSWLLTVHDKEHCMTEIILDFCILIIFFLLNVYEKVEKWTKKKSHLGIVGLPEWSFTAKLFPYTLRQGHNIYWTIIIHIICSNSGVAKKHQKFIFEYWVFTQKSYLNVWCFEKVHICIPKIPYLHTYRPCPNFSVPASVKARSSLVYNVFHQIGKIRISGICGKGYEFWQGLWAKLILE